MIRLLENVSQKQRYRNTVSDHRVGTFTPLVHARTGRTPVHTAERREALFFCSSTMAASTDAWRSALNLIFLLTNDVSRHVI